MTTSPTPGLPEGYLDRWVRRRRTRRRRIGWVVGVLAVGLVAGAWAFWFTMHRHWLAASSLRIDGLTVRWELDDGGWRRGGTTHVLGTNGPWFFSNLTDAELAPLADLRHVETLALVRCLNLTDDGLTILRKLPELRSLDLTMTRPHPSFAPSRLTDGVLDHLAGLDRLEDLSLVDVAITDAGLSRFPALPNLRFLDLSGTRITGAGLAALVDRLPALETVAVENTAVTPEEAADLRQHRPGLLVTRDASSVIDSEPY